MKGSSLIVFFYKQMHVLTQSYLLFADVHHLHCAPQLLNVLGCHLHHLLDLPSLLWPSRHALDFHPFSEALGNKKFPFILTLFKKT